MLRYLLTGALVLQISRMPMALAEVAGKKSPTPIDKIMSASKRASSARNFFSSVNGIMLPSDYDFIMRKTANLNAPVPKIVALGEGQYKIEVGGTFVNLQIDRANPWAITINQKKLDLPLSLPIEERWKLVEEALPKESASIFSLILPEAHAFLIPVIMIGCAILLVTADVAEVSCAQARTRSVTCGGTKNWKAGMPIQEDDSNVLQRSVSEYAIFTFPGHRKFVNYSCPSDLKSLDDCLAAVRLKLQQVRPGAGADVANPTTPAVR